MTGLQNLEQNEMEPRRSAIDQRALLTVRQAAIYLGRTEKAIRHLYNRGTLTPIRIDARVQIDPRQIDALIDAARREAQIDKN